MVSVVAPPGIGNVVLVTGPVTRATWDALVTVIENFKTSHPEVQSVNYQWTEQSTG